MGGLMLAAGLNPLQYRKELGCGDLGDWLAAEIRKDECLESLLLLLEGARIQG
jgi:hypothetical protein